MSVVVIGLAVSFIGHVGYAAGWIPGWEGEQFVSRSELVKLSDVTLTKAIYEAKRDQCEAHPGSKARTTYSQIVSEFARQYKELTGHDFDVPECDDL